VWLAALAAGAMGTPEEQLAERYAPVLRLQAQAEPCGHGEPFEPIDVRRLFGNEEVALRGPWDGANLVAVAPRAADLASGRAGYHLDFPGDPLAPGCDYERWSRRLAAGSEPTTYGRVVTEAARPGQLALQYWFFFPYNDFNNKHEGDWEMIQLVFEAADAARALSTAPARVGYSQHEGAEQARWGAHKLELEGGTHPVVHPAAGSHANYFEPGLYLGRSAAQGVGCDDTTGPWRRVAPRVELVPSDPSAYLVRQPWLGYDGRWGERRPGFYNGPTGPNLKAQWTAPIRWSEETWRERSFAVAGGTLLGPQATDFFCDGVERGSNLLREFSRRPLLVGLALAALAAVAFAAALRTRWRPAAPLRLERRRATGQLLAASLRLLRLEPRLFLGIGLIFVPVGLVAEGLRVGSAHLVASLPVFASEGESEGFAVGLSVCFGAIAGSMAFAVVQAVCARAMLEIDAGRPPRSARSCYRMALPRLPATLGALLLAALGVVPAAVFGVGIPLALWLAGRWSLLAQTTQIEDLGAREGLRRSAELVRGHFGRVAALAALLPAALSTGPLLGALLLLLTPLPFVVVNLVSSIVYAVTLPVAAAATTYLYFDLRVRWRLEPRAAKADVLPAEGAPPAAGG
jgi:Vacuolar protein sorting-associated protein 62